MSLAHSAIFVSPSWWMHSPPLKNGDKEKGAGELTCQPHQKRNGKPTLSHNQCTTCIAISSSSYKDNKAFDRYAISKLCHLGLSFAELLVAYRCLISQVRYFKDGFLELRK